MKKLLASIVAALLLSATAASAATIYTQGSNGEWVPVQTSDGYVGGKY